MELFDQEVKIFLSVKQLIAAGDVADLVGRVVKDAEFVKQDVTTLKENFKLLENGSGASDVDFEEFFLLTVLEVELRVYAV